MMLYRGGAKNAFTSRDVLSIANDVDPTLCEMANDENPMMYTMIKLMEQQSRLIQDMAIGRVGA